MKIKQQIARAASDVAKGLAREPVEVLKTAGEQVGARIPQEPPKREESQEIKPGVVEKKRHRLIQALKTEIEDIRERGESEARRKRKEEEAAEAQEKASQVEKRETLFQRIIKKFQRRVEGPKLPQAT